MKLLSKAGILTFQTIKVQNMNKRLLIALCAIFSLASCTHAQQVVQVTSVEAAKVIASDPKMLILDVRTGDEFKDTSNLNNQTLYLSSQIKQIGFI